MTSKPMTVSKLDLDAALVECTDALTFAFSVECYESSIHASVKGKPASLTSMGKALAALPCPDDASDDQMLLHHAFTTVFSTVAGHDDAAAKINGFWSQPLGIGEIDLRPFSIAVSLREFIKKWQTMAAHSAKCDDALFAASIRLGGCPVEFGTILAISAHRWTWKYFRQSIDRLRPIVPTKIIEKRVLPDEAKFAELEFMKELPQLLASWPIVEVNVQTIRRVFARLEAEHRVAILEQDS